MPLDDSQRSKRKRNKKTELGFVYFRKYITPEQKEDIDRYLSGELKMVEVKRVRNKRSSKADNEL